MATYAYLHDLTTGSRHRLGRFNEGRATSLAILSRVFRQCHLDTLGCVTDYEVWLNEDGARKVSLYELKHIMIQ